MTVTDLQPRRLEVAEALGAYRTINVQGQGMEPLRDGAPYDCIIDCSGAPSLLQQIHEMRLLAYNGVIGLVAVRSQTEFPWAMLHGTEASIEVSCRFSLHDLRVLLHCVQQGTIRIEPTVSHVVPIEQAPAVHQTHGCFLEFHAKILRCGSMSHPPVGEIQHHAVAPVLTLVLRGVTVGGLICNDLWANPACTPMPNTHLTQQLAAVGAKVIFHAVNGGRDGSEWSRVAWRYHEANLRLRAMTAEV